MCLVKRASSGKQPVSLSDTVGSVVRRLLSEETTLENRMKELQLEMADIRRTIADNNTTLRVLGHAKQHTANDMATEVNVGKVPCTA